MTEQIRDFAKLKKLDMHDKDIKQQKYHMQILTHLPTQIICSSRLIVCNLSVSYGQGIHEFGHNCLLLGIDKTNLVSTLHQWTGAAL